MENAKQNENLLNDFSIEMERQQSLKKKQQLIEQFVDEQLRQPASGRIKPKEVHKLELLPRDEEQRKGSWILRLETQRRKQVDLKRERVFDEMLEHPKSIWHFKAQDQIEPVPIKPVKTLATIRMPQMYLSEILPEYKHTIERAGNRPNLPQMLCQLFRQNIGPTMCVAVGDRQFYCHSLLLTLMSNIFHRRSHGQTLQLSSNKMTPRCFISVYRWFFEPLTSVTLSQLIELLRGCEFLENEELRSQCWRLAFDTLKLPHYVLAMYKRAHFASANIERAVLPFLSRVWLTFAVSQEFVNLNADQMRQLLHMNNLAVNTEMEIVYTLVLWLNHDWIRRERHALDLMQMLRFDMMPFVFLVTFQKRTDGSPALPFLAQSLAAADLIHDALQLICDNPDRCKGGVGKCPRDYIYDPCCSYHHGKACNTERYATYSEFMQYMNWLQDIDYSYKPDQKLHRIKNYSDPNIVCCKPDPDL